MKRLVALIMSAVMLFVFASCGKKNNTANNNGTDKGALEIYYLNFKPEIADIYKDIAQTYERETGVKVKVVTAASDTYETTLKSEIAKSEAPTIFQINGPVGLSGWKNY